MPRYSFAKRKKKKNKPRGAGSGQEKVILLFFDSFKVVYINSKSKRGNGGIKATPVSNKKLGVRIREINSKVIPR